MIDTLIHRGPDGEGILVKNHFGFGIRRLSIIDLETGNQPISNEDASLSIVCNGEIYNYIELRRYLEKKGHQFQTGSDVEVIPHLYEEHGDDCVQYLRGMFAFALWDDNRQRLMLARDRLGIKPLVFAEDHTGFYFASEIKAILSVFQSERCLDPEALHELLTLGFIRAPRTLFKNIYSLLPGSLGIWQKNLFKIRSYWDLHFPHVKTQLTMHDWAEGFRAKFDETVKLHLRSDVPVASWLSAGIDSSAVVSVMRHHVDTLQTISLSFQDRSYDEITNQKTLSDYKAYDLHHREVQCTDAHFHWFPKSIWHLENPDFSSVHLAEMILAKETKQVGKVVLTGDGADEVFGGYPWFRFDQWFRPFYLIPDKWRSMLILESALKNWKPWESQLLIAPSRMDFKRYPFLIGIFDPAVRDGLFASRIKNKLGKGEQASETFRYPESFQTWDRLQKLLYIETKTRLPDYINIGLDRMSMAFSVEVRVPFLDHELVELCAQIPSRLKIRYREKAVLREAMRGEVPETIRLRKKRGLSGPGTHWLQKDLPETHRNLLSRDMLKRYGYFNPGAVEKILSEHRAQKRNWARLLIAVLGVQTWHRLFIENDLSLLEQPI
jgi:asparagine synthase (glutamine-hydrolysing)